MKKILFILWATIVVAHSQEKLGVTELFDTTDGSNAGYILAQSANLATPGTLQSISFYVNKAAGRLTLGVYDSTGPHGPGNLVASTGSFTPIQGWNSVQLSHVALQPGQYWL